MDDNHKHFQLREVVTNHILNSEFKNQIKYRENEVVYPGDVNRDIKITGRVNRNKENSLIEFREELYDKIAEILGNEEATDFLNSNVQLDIGISKGDKFTGLDVVDLNGNSLKLNHEAGKVLMLDFWATWCKFCQQPMQENIDLVTNNQKLAENNVIIVGLSCDEDTQKWKNHIEQKNWSLIPQYVKKGLLKELGIKGIPCILIVNKQGIISFIGHPSEINLEQFLLSTQNEKLTLSENDSNYWWNIIDENKKINMIKECNLILENSGVKNATFCVSSRLEYDPETNQMQALKITPTFFGDVTPFENDTVKESASTLQTKYNFNDFSYKMKVIEFGAGEDF
jgi:thiol-disulfide isomerase/thioredoxin